jgi:hypothetical protein
MKSLYFCPKCQATLNPNVKVVLSARKEGHAGLVLLNPKPGIYEPIVADDLNLETGEKVDFYCPICHEVLTSRADDNLAELGFRDAEGEEGRVDFSRIFGEHATYIVMKGQVRAYGEQSSRYGGGNFFGERVDTD